jgi:kynurenine formamidase
MDLAARARVGRAARIGVLAGASVLFASWASVARAAPLVINEGNLVDLTYTFDDKTVYWPTEEGFHLEQGAHGLTPQGYFYSANRFEAAEHGGTHTDAPSHFGEGKMTVDQIPLTSLVGPAVVIDVSKAAAKDHDYRLRVDDLQRWEGKYGRIPDGAIVLMRSGWGHFWPDKRKYLGTDQKGDVANLHFPGFSKEAAEWLVGQRAIDAIAVDTPSIDYGPSKDFIVHQTINGANKPGFENVANLDRLPESGATIIALPR